MCVFTISINTFDGILFFFQTERSYHRKTVKFAIIQIFALGSCTYTLFSIKSYVLFFLHFLPGHSVRNSGAFFCCLSILNVYVNCRLE